MIQDIQGGAAQLSAGDFLLILSLVLIVSKFFGEMAERFRQSAVLGELVAGAVLGAGVLAVMPSSPAETGYHVFHLIAELAVVVLLFEIGLETRLGDILKTGPVSLLVAALGVVAPFGLGFASIYALDAYGVMSWDASAIFLVAVTTGATLTATSVGITARVLSDINQLGAPESKIIIGAAVIDDVVGLIILSIVSGLIQSSAAGVEAGVSFSGIALTTVKAFGFLFAAVALGNIAAPKFFAFAANLKSRGALVVCALSVAFLYAYAGEHLAGVAPIVGAFAAGLVIRRTDQFRDVENSIKPVSDFLVPVFFVAVGAQVDVRILNPFAEGNSQVLAVALILFVLAFAGKYVSAIGALGGGIRKSIVGIGMVPRGEVGLIFAQIGYNNGKGVFDKEFFSAIVLTVMLTTFVVPPLLQRGFGGGAEADGDA
ncbi:MAG: cation:proton antiporter [Candidatus Dadabacteria bacterium]|nr:cation:proton antiporter [Candidatus Dadabacteria bacterium]